MKYKSIIFDLDQTLVDSSALELMRKNRQWSKVLSSLNLIKFEPKVNNLLNYLTNSGMQIGIITNSPSIYAIGVLKYFSIPYSHIVAYHDVQRRKPDPEAFLKMVSIIGGKADDFISVGDHDNDIIASQSAKIEAIGAKWYTPNYTFSTHPNYVVNTVEELEKYLNSYIC